MQTRRKRTLAFTLVSTVILLLLSACGADATATPAAEASNTGGAVTVETATTEDQSSGDSMAKDGGAMARDGDSTVPDFVAKRRELICLAQHWANEALVGTWSFFKSQAPIPNIHWRYAKWRVRHIADLIGEKGVRMAVDAVRDLARKDLGKHCDARTWDIFLNYDDEQTKAFYVEVEEGRYRPLEP